MCEYQQGESVQAKPAVISNDRLGGEIALAAQPKPQFCTQLLKYKQNLKYNLTKTQPVRLLVVPKMGLCRSEA
ncbi:hypothetical protein DHD05_14375 [Arenibacter sp. N53]|nr:hypothetical protein [Arenibacter sp. N53]